MMGRWESVPDGWTCHRGHFVENDSMDDDLSMSCPACEKQEQESDTRWRPMRTAPRDGTVVESDSKYWARPLLIYHDNGPQPTVWVDYLRGEVLTLYQPDRWRPAHPEWQEGDS